MPASCHHPRLPGAALLLTASLLGGLALPWQPARAQTAPADQPANPAPPASPAPATAPPADAASPIPIELNKTESVGQGGSACRLYFVAGNPGHEAIPMLRLDLIVFGADGVIAQRNAFDIGPLAAKKSIAVRLFDVTALPCDKLGRVVVNDVLSCKLGAATGEPSDADRAGCLDRLALSTRTKAGFEK